MSELVQTPAGKGRITAAAQLPKEWRVRVELLDGGTWAGSAKELKGRGVEQALRKFRRRLGEEVPG